MSIVARYTEDTYYFHTEDSATSITLDRVRSDRNGAIRAETEVRWNIKPKDGLLKHGDLNLLADRTIQTWATELGNRIPYDWYKVLTAVTKLAKDRYRAGDPPTVLADVDPTDRPPWFVNPFLQHGGPTVIAADGGTGKSLFALAFAAMVASGHSKLLNVTAPATVPVLYLDWETDRYMHRDRLGALASAANIDLPRGIHYRREYAPLSESVTELAKYVNSLGVGFVVVDSKGAALGGAPEDAESTIRLFRACRQLGVPALIVDHITNEAADRGGAKRPFGSRYTRNLARNVWMMSKASDQPGQITVVMELTKSNDGPEGIRRAWRVFIEKDDDGRYKRIEFRHTDPTAVQVLDPEKQPNVEKVEAALRAAAQPLTVKEIMAMVPGMSEQTVRNQFTDFPERFEQVGDSLPKRWLLKVRASLPDPF